MQLNSDKCKAMHITRSRKQCLTPYFLSDSVPLQVITSYKYLGVILSNDLTWNKHINMIRAKCSKLSGFIRRTVKSRNAEVLLKLFSSLCRPVLEYGSPVWLPHQKNHIQCLETVQRRFTKSCLPYNIATLLSYEERLKKINLPPLYNRLIYLSVSFVVKCLYKHNNIPSSFLPQPNNRKTDVLLFKHQYNRTNCAKFSLFSLFPRFVNSLPCDLRDLCLEPSCKCFLNALRDHLFNQDPISHYY